MLLAPSAAALIAACGTRVPTGELDAGDNADVVVPIDALSDAGETDGGDSDTAVADATTDADAAETDAGGNGAPGTPCTSDVDCDSGLCVDLVPGDALGGFCSEPCASSESCPDGFECIFVTGSGDGARICVPVDLCVDADGDGYGQGPGCAGPDCDDNSIDAHFGLNEICDGIDNDCDGDIDDAPGDANQDCDTGFLGECAAGRTVCTGGLLTCESRVGATSEVCDTRDNDCDGDVDEDELGEALVRPCFDGDSALIGVGICVSGTQTCRDGGYSGCLGQQLPSDETCDSIDSDCDERIDEGAACYPNGVPCEDNTDCVSGLCETGVCTRPLTCVDLGTCPPRFAANAGGGRLQTGRYVLDIAAGAGTSSPVLRTSRYRMTVGPSPYVTDP